MLPEWVLKHKKPGHRIQSRNGKYYYFKVTSKRVAGKKNPQPVQTYIGQITEEGIIKSRYSVDHAIVYEYGFAKICLIIGEQLFKNATPLAIVRTILKLSIDNDENTNIVNAYATSILSYYYPKIKFDGSAIDEESILTINLLNEFNKLNISFNEIRLIFKNIFVANINKRNVFNLFPESANVILGNLGIEEEFLNVKTKKQA